MAEPATWTYARPKWATIRFEQTSPQDIRRVMEQYAMMRIRISLNNPSSAFKGPWLTAFVGARHEGEKDIVEGNGGDIRCGSVEAFHAAIMLATEHVQRHMEPAK